MGGLEQLEKCSYLHICFQLQASIWRISFWLHDRLEQQIPELAT